MQLDIDANSPIAAPGANASASPLRIYTSSFKNFPSDTRERGDIVETVKKK